MSTSAITKENAHLYQANSAQCGVVDTQTGEFKKGHINRRGQLVYRNPLPWWKRIWGMKSKVELWGPSEYVHTFTGTQTWIDWNMFRGARFSEHKTTGVVYRETHRYTGEKRYWVRAGGCDRYIDSEAFERAGKVVTIE